MIREFRKTDIGLLPVDWDLKTLEEISSKITVGIASAATHAYRQQGIPLIRNQNIKPNRLDDGDILYITPDYEAKFKNKRLASGDLLTARTGYPGTTCLVPEKFNNAQSFTTLITRPNPIKIDSKYLSFYINSDSGQDFFDKNQIGGGQKNVNAGTLRRLLIPLPSRQEQERIAAALSDVDELIGALDALIAKKRDIKTAVMQQLLTGKTRLPGFDEGVGMKQTELGEIPADWDTVPLNFLLKLLTDFEANGSFESVAKNVTIYNEENYAWYVRGTDLENNSPMQNVKFVDERSYKFLAKTTLTGGELLLTKRGDIGKVYMFKMQSLRATLAPNLYLLKLNPNINAIYLYYFFKSNLGQTSLTGKNASTTLGALYKDDVKSIEIPYPSLLEQKAISSILIECDNEIKALEQQRTKTKAIKQGMMQELLTGRTRLL